MLIITRGYTQQKLVKSSVVIPIIVPSRSSRRSSSPQLLHRGLRVALHRRAPGQAQRWPAAARGVLSSSFRGPKGGTCRKRLWKIWENDWKMGKKWICGGKILESLPKIGKTQQPWWEYGGKVWKKNEENEIIVEMMEIEIIRTLWKNSVIRLRWRTTGTVHGIPQPRG